jgi:hypothetical protein
VIPATELHHAITKLTHFRHSAGERYAPPLLQGEIVAAIAGGPRLGHGI